MKSREKEREMEGGVKERGDREAISCSRRKCITGIAVETLHKSALGVLKLVCESSTEWRPRDGEAGEIRSKVAEMNEKEVLGGGQRSP